MSLPLLTALFALLARLFAAYPTLCASLQLAAAGVALEACRRFAYIVANAVMSSVLLQVNVPQTDASYEWLMLWLTQHGASETLLSPSSSDPTSAPTSTSNSTSTSKVDTSSSLTRPHLPSSSRPGFTSALTYYRSPIRSIIDNVFEHIWPTGRVPPRNVEAQTDWEPSPSKMTEEEDGEGKVKVRYVPAQNTKQTIKFKGHYITLMPYRIVEGYDTYSWISISGYLLPRDIITDLIQTSKSEYDARHIGTIGISGGGADHMRPGGDNGWTGVARKRARPWDSVNIPNAIKEELFTDAKEFLGNPRFYMKRGLPHRRGYLLHGKPGTGKSSLVGAIAAKVNADIYTLNLSHKGLDDASLQHLLISVPPSSILLIEDIDCAFNDRTKDSDDSGSDSDSSPTHTSSSGSTEGKKKKKRRRPRATPNVTLSGLLNAIDGVAAAEGRLMFCATNHVDEIDSALSRPGRCDVWVEFGFATPEQIRELFLYFYSPAHDDSDDEGEVSTSFKARPTSSSKPHDQAETVIGIDEKLALPRSDDINLVETFDEKAPPPSFDATLYASEATPPPADTPDNLVTLPTPAATPTSRAHNLISLLNPRAELPPSPSSLLDRLDRLADEFVDAVPKDAVTTSALQGYLMRFKGDSERAVAGVEKWVRSGYVPAPTATLVA